jgi:hypothetical protein
MLENETSILYFVSILLSSLLAANEIIAWSKCRENSLLQLIYYRGRCMKDEENQTDPTIITV